MTAEKLIERLEVIIESKLLECWPEFWDENFITQTLLKQVLQDFILQFGLTDVIIREVGEEHLKYTRLKEEIEADETKK